MKNISKKLVDYRASLQNYALSLSVDESFMGKLGLSEEVLDFVFALAHGAREREFVKYVLNLDHSRHPVQRAA